MMKKLLSLFLILFMSGEISFGHTNQPNWKSLDTRKVPGWFHNDKFGIFIHWGVYAVPSFSGVVPDGYSEWYWCNYNDSTRQNFKVVREFHNRTYGKDFTHDQFVPMFKAELFKPDEWAEIFKKSGAKYVVLTSKHHDGYCLWPGKESDISWGRPWNAFTKGPQRDVLGELTDYKTSQELILMMVDIVLRGGNLLLDIGSAADVTILVIIEGQQRLMLNYYLPAKIPMFITLFPRMQPQSPLKMYMQFRPQKSPFLACRNQLIGRQPKMKLNLTFPIFSPGI